MNLEHMFVHHFEPGKIWLGDEGGLLCHCLVVAAALLSYLFLFDKTVTV